MSIDSITVAATTCDKCGMVTAGPTAAFHYPFCPEIQSNALEGQIVQLRRTMETLQGENTRLAEDNEKLRKALSQRLQQLERLRDGVLEIAEHRPMSAMTRQMLRELIGIPEHGAPREAVPGDFGLHPSAPHQE